MGGVIATELERWIMARESSKGDCCKGVFEVRGLIDF